MKHALLLVAGLLSFPGSAFAGEPVRYLAFQLFTSSLDSKQMRASFPPSPEDMLKTVKDLRERIGVAPADGRMLGFVLGPIAFDHTDEQVRKLVAIGFDVAVETGVAVGFHIDDSMFWGRLKELDTPDNLEWLDWKGTPNTGRRLDWSERPTKIMPQLCINSKAVRKAVSDRAALIGAEIARGVNKLRAARQDSLFLGVIAGWETQIGRDFDTGSNLGYHALTNAGYSAASDPADLDAARARIIQEFAGFWAKSLNDAGVPDGKVYSHIAYMSETMFRVMRQARPDAVAVPYLRTIHFTPPSTAFCDSCIPGLSTYPQAGHLEQWRAELKKHGNPSWASCEGTALDPAEAARSGKGMSMEHYLGNLFNHGAVMVNIFGWGVGGKDNPFRKTAENDNALQAYRKFLRGEKLDEAAIPIPKVPPAGLPEKIQKLQAKLPGWIEKNGPSLVKDNIEKLDKALREQRFEDAAEIVEAVLRTIDK